MTHDEMDALFAMADMARRTTDAEEGRDDMEEEDDPSIFFANAPKRKTVRGRAVCHPLADGDFHMCFGLQCDQLSLDSDRQLVCMATGLVVGTEHARDLDPSWTGRSTGSANPDDHAGTPIGGWVRRRDMFSASVTAYRNAHNISDAEIVLPPPARPPANNSNNNNSPRHTFDGANGSGGSGSSSSNGSSSSGGSDRVESGCAGDGGRSTAKRGALCVDETPPVESAHAKRPRPQRRESWSRDALEKLSGEAMHVIAALLIVEAPLPPPQGATGTAQSSSSSSFAKPKNETLPPPSQSAVPAPPRLDPRLQNPEFVRTVALRKYVKACAEGRQRLDLNVLHDICLYANEFVRAQREAAAGQAAAAAAAAAGQQQQQQQQQQQVRRAATTAGCGCSDSGSSSSSSSSKAVAQRRRGPGFSGQVRRLIADLIVSLWRATCATPHMRDNKRGSDSFRPFAAGILYSFKRGIYLNDGTCVVPALDALAVHLPALRSPQSTSAAKQLQSSSHRGICSFHRSITSIELMEPQEAQDVRRLFSDAAGQAAFLRALVHQDATGSQRC